MSSAKMAAILSRPQCVNNVHYLLSAKSATVHNITSSSHNETPQCALVIYPMVVDKDQYSCKDIPYVPLVSVDPSQLDGWCRADNSIIGYNGTCTSLNCYPVFIAKIKNYYYD